MALSSVVGFHKLAVQCTSRQIPSEDFVDFSEDFVLQEASAGGEENPSAIGRNVDPWLKPTSDRIDDVLCLARLKEDELRVSLFHPVLTVTVILVLTARLLFISFLIRLRLKTEKESRPATYPDHTLTTIQ